MDPNTRQRLLDRYNALDRNEREKLAKKARDMRARLTKTAPRDRRAYDEDDGAPARRAAPTLETFLLRLLAQEEPEGGEAAVVVGLAKGRATVEKDGNRLVLPLAPRLAAEQQSAVAVGDEVTVADGVVRAVRPRRTWLGREDPLNGHGRVIVANVDVVVVVVSVVAPPLHPRIIDRYLIAIARGGAQPLVAVNKIDLGDAELSLLDPYRAAGIEVVPCSADSGIGLDDLRGRLEGKTCAFVGHSGVGKSSLMNALAPQIGQETGAVSDGYGRGTHTTTASSMFDLGGRTRLVDTPGIRSFGLGKLTLEELAWGFPEFEGLGCRLRGCSHGHEPGCAVREAVERGELSGFRYETYLGLLEGMG